MNDNAEILQGAILRIQLGNHKLLVDMPIDDWRKLYSQLGELFNTPTAELAYAPVSLPDFTEPATRRPAGCVCYWQGLSAKDPFKSHPDCPIEQHAELAKKLGNKAWEATADADG